MKSKENLSLPELKRLLVELKQLDSNNKVRLRMLGKMWENQFHTIISITSENVLITRSEKNQLNFFPIKDIIQLELEDRFQDYESLVHYRVEFGDSF